MINFQRAELPSRKIVFRLAQKVFFVNKKGILSRKTPRIIKLRKFKLKMLQVLPVPPGSRFRRIFSEIHKREADAWRLAGRSIG